jgi:hypothetical protein
MKKLTPEQIIQIVAEYYEIPVKDVMTVSQRREIVTVRAVSCFFMKKYIRGITLTQIGSYFPGRNKAKDHATVLHLIKSVNNLVDSDKSYKADIECLNELFNVSSVKSILSENKTLKMEVAMLRNELRLSEGNLEQLRTLSNPVTTNVTPIKRSDSYHAYIDQERQSMKPYSGYKAVRA